jgi:hypothetical protein
MNDDAKKLRTSTQYLRRCTKEQIKAHMQQICSNNSMEVNNKHLSAAELAAICPRPGVAWNPVFPKDKPIIAPFAAGVRDRPQVRINDANKKKIYCSHVACK